MSQIELKATSRDVTGKQVKALRRAGQIPAVIYGHNMKPLNICLDFKETSYLLPTISSSQLITLMVGETPHVALVRERQRHPVSGYLVHIDFQEVSMTEKLRVTVRLHFMGESPAVKELDGVITINQEQLDVECLPNDLPSRIEVDLSTLKTIGSALHVRDIVLPANVEMRSNPDDMIVVITAPLKEADEADGAAGAAEPEVIEKGKKEEADF